MEKKDLVNYQQEAIAKRQAELDAAKEKRDAYLESEQYLRDQWEAQENRWAEKATREGWSYEKKPFVSALQRQQAEEQAIRQEVAYLKEKLAELEKK